MTTVVNLSGGVALSANIARRCSMPAMLAAASSRASLPNDPIGTTTVTFDGVNAGSEIRIYLPDGTEVAGVETCEANHILTWSVYAHGSPNNTVRIVIVHLDYKIKEFIYVSRIGAQSIPVQQEPDKWRSNPA